MHFKFIDSLFYCDLGIPGIQHTDSLYVIYCIMHSSVDKLDCICSALLWTIIIIIDSVYLSYVTASSA